MKKIVYIILCTLSFNLVIGQDFNYYSDYNKIKEETKKDNSNLNYFTLLNRFLSRDTSLTDYEMLVLMIGFTNQKQYNPLVISKKSAELYYMNRKKSTDSVLVKSKKLFLEYPLCEQVLLEYTYALFNLEQRDTARYYAELHKKLVRGMSVSGDGLSPDNPIFALDEVACQDYVLMYLRRGLGFIWTIEDKKGESLQMIESIIKNEDKTESRVMLYFKCSHK